MLFYFSTHLVSLIFIEYNIEFIENYCIIILRFMAKIFVVNTKCIKKLIIFQHGKLIYYRNSKRILLGVKTIFECQFFKFHNVTSKLYFI